MDVAWLGEPHAHEPAAVGGKAASLSRLAADYRVPPGFALTAKALALAAPDLARGSVPEPLHVHIAEAYAILGGGRIAVRSSAIDEDGDAHSFAGQHETFLNIEGVYGMPGSPGVARGRVRVLRSLADGDVLEHGEILVAETTAPPWAPLFARAGAIVTDAGGILSHCAVVAREYSIAAVVGTKRATGVLRDGQLVEVDGTSGSVRIIAA